MSELEFAKTAQRLTNKPCSDSGTKAQTNDREWYLINSFQIEIQIG